MVLGVALLALGARLLVTVDRGLRSRTMVNEGWRLYFVGGYLSPLLLVVHLNEKGGGGGGGRLLEASFPNKMNSSSEGGGGDLKQSEVFSFTWSDVMLICPPEGGQAVGHFFFASFYHTLSSLGVGTWFRLFRTLNHVVTVDDPRLIFLQFDSHQVWTSAHFQSHMV